jgi:sugar lactone lactonase YvrE
MMHQIEIIADYGDLCGEAPVWDAEQQRLFWSDCVGAKFYEYRLNQREHQVLYSGFEINGLVLNADGKFVVTNGSGFWLWDGKGAPTLLAARAGEDKCQLNDCVADKRGRVLSCSVFYDPVNDYPLGKLLVLDGSGHVRVLDEGFHLGNGMGFSADGRTLFVSDSVARRIYSYDYDSDAGTTSERRVFVQVPGQQGLPDGLEVDSADFVWSAQWYGSCIVRYNPKGEIDKTVITPAKQTSSLAFGGPDLMDIFITSARKPEPMPIMPEGYSPGTGYVGGALFRVNVGIKGRQTWRARIQMAV